MPEVGVGFHTDAFNSTHKSFEQALQWAKDHDVHYIEPGVIENHVPGNNMIVIGRADRAETPFVQKLRKALEDADMSSPPLADIDRSGAEQPMR